MASACWAINVRKLLRFYVDQPEISEYRVRVQFEFDPDKSQKNKRKHGLDFIEAQALWRDDRRVEVPAHTRGEPRIATIGAIEGEVWVAVWTPRDTAVRLISVRRARTNEGKIYEG